MFEEFLPGRAAVERLRGGAFGPHLDSFVATLRQQGYARSTVRSRLRFLDDLQRWLGQNNLALVALHEAVVLHFLEERRNQGRLWKGDAPTAHHFLRHLREKDAISSPAPAVDLSPLAALRQRYEDYLTKERGLSPVTVVGYWRHIGRFLVERFGDAPLCLREIVPTDVSAFLLRHARSGSPKVAQMMVAGLRSFFRFLFQHAETDRDLAAAVPTVPQWRLAEVPKYLTPAQVEQVVQACRRDTAAARRDHAIILLLARLGLRASEVIALQLDDIDWRAGVLTVRGKGGYHDPLPLPADVGEAIATYLRHHRPPCTSRRVFIRTRAPHRGFAHLGSISTIVCRALNRAGLEPKFKGAHVLRHSLATGMLRAGASMGEIGEVLRHRVPNTTEIYAKVDIQGLRLLARPWPIKGGEQ
jgi:site-specific recombinase XerD